MTTRRCLIALALGAPVLDCRTFMRRTASLGWETVTAPACVCKEFIGYSRPVDQEICGESKAVEWVVMHLPSGLQISGASFEECPVDVLRQLAALPADAKALLSRLADLILSSANPQESEHIRKQLRLQPAIKAALRLPQAGGAA